MNYEETYRNFDEEYRNFDEEYKKLYAAAQTGMTLRDYFAAKAMQGLISNNGTNPFEIAKAAYVVADEMMKAREA
jgi:hypothetical protein